MKKISSLLLVSIVAALFIFNFSGCEKLKIDNLKANSHLKKANQFYTEEKYKKAVEEYQEALTLNPNLKVVYFYLGTAYASLYKPGKVTMRENEAGEKIDVNKLNGDKAIEYLEMAKENDPENPKIDMAKAEIYDKLAIANEDEEEREKYYKKSEEIYLQLMDKDKENPTTYYILASFYLKHGKFDEAESMYKKRIALDPTDESGYLYYANYAQDLAKWDIAIKCHKQRINAIKNPQIGTLEVEISGIESKIEQINKKLEFIEKHVKRNRKISKKTKEDMIAQKNQEIEEIGNMDELKTELEAKINQRTEMIVASEEDIKNFTPEKTKKLAEASYSLGVVTFYKCYNAKTDEMSAKERLMLVDIGMKALDLATNLNPDYAEPWSYKGLLYNEMAKAEPLKRAEYKKKYDEMIAQFKKLREKQLAAEAYKQQLEEMGEE